MPVVCEYQEDEGGRLYLPTKKGRTYFQVSKEEMLKKSMAYVLADSLRLHDLWWDNGAITHIRKFSSVIVKEGNQTTYKFKDGSALIDSVFLRKRKKDGYYLSQVDEK
jgi:hypothetical protein